MYSPSITISGDSWPYVWPEKDPVLLNELKTIYENSVCPAVPACSPNNILEQIEQHPADVHIVFATDPVRNLGTGTERYHSNIDNLFSNKSLTQYLSWVEKQNNEFLEKLLHLTANSNLILIGGCQPIKKDIKDITLIKNLKNFVGNTTYYNNNCLDFSWMPHVINNKWKKSLVDYCHNQIEHITNGPSDDTFHLSNREMLILSDYLKEILAEI